MSDTWDEVVKALDKYSMEAWRAGRRAAIEEIIQRFEACLCFEKYECTEKRCLDIMAFIHLAKGEK